MSDKKFDRMIVCGDLVRDYHIAQMDRPAATYSAAGSAAILHVTPGGAYYLRNVIDALDVADHAAVIGSTYAENAPIHEAYQVWKPFPDARKDAGKGDRVWRVDRFLGCRKGSAGAELQPAVKAPSSRDLLVIDNLGLRAMDDGTVCDKLNPIAKACGHILIKSSAAAASTAFCGDLFKKYAGKITLIVSATTLRESGASLSRGLSWDRTIEECVGLFAPTGILSAFSACARIFVHFGRAGVVMFSRHAKDLAYPDEAPSTVWSSAQLVRFIYAPQSHEGVIEEATEGRLYGVGTLLAAALARHTVHPESYPVFIACAGALEYSREMLEAGGGNGNNDLPEPRPDATELKKRLASARDVKTGDFCCHFPRRNDTPENVSYGFPSEADLSSGNAKVNLLRDVAGAQKEAVAALATEIVLRGPDKALGQIPRVRFGKYLTVDREEIERTNAFRRAYVHYLENHREVRPLSIAVFGPPGSGKSFAIKQVTGSCPGGAPEPLTFNLSQMRDREELIAAFHQIRDASLTDGVPLVFFDEFDTDDFRWLKEFLMPMQDNMFWDGHASHPFGKAVFVFAGAVCHRFSEFNATDVPKDAGEERNTAKTPESNALDAGEGAGEENKAAMLAESDASDADKDEVKKRKAAKVPDFISRLRGYIDIKGPNDNTDLDIQIGTHIVRRALILRHELEVSCLDIIDSDTKQAAIGLDVVRWFLFAPQFEHGARSLSAIVSTSRLGGQHRFTAACLPPPDVLDIHLRQSNATQTAWSQDTRLSDAGLIEALAEACHEAWMAQKKADGYVYGEKRNDDPEKGKLTHPLMIDYAELSEDAKAANRKPARLVLVKTMMAQCRIKQMASSGPVDTFPASVRDKLARLEHDFWVRDHLLDGWEFAGKTDDKLRRHRCVQACERLTESDRVLDLRIVESIPKALHKCGYCLVPEAT